MYVQNGHISRKIQAAWTTLGFMDMRLIVTFTIILYDYT